MSADELSGAAGIALSLICSYAPGIKDKFDALTPTEKRLVMAALLLIVTCAVFVAGCRGWLSITCDEAGVLGLARSLVIALIANQGVFLISPKAKKL